MKFLANGIIFVWDAHNVRAFKTLLSQLILCDGYIFIVFTEFTASDTSIEFITYKGTYIDISKEKFMPGS